jgi:hypothetical protein
MVPPIPAHLQTRLAQRHVIPFAGAGVARAVVHHSTHEPLFPGWHELLLRSAAALMDAGLPKPANTIKALLDEDIPDYQDIARRAAESLRDRWYGFLHSHFDRAHSDAAPESLALARSIWALDSPLIVTTNYDRVLQWACPSEAQPDLRVWNIEANLEQGKFLSDGPRHPTLWHLHGSIERPETIILTAQGYDALYRPQSLTSALATLRVLLTRYTFLFIGFSFEDPEFSALLEEFGTLFLRTNVHYVLVRGEPEAERIRKLQLPLEPISFADFGEPLLALMGALAECARRAQAERRLNETVSRLSSDELDALLALISEVTKTGRDSTVTLGRLAAILHSSDDEGLLRAGNTIATDLQQELRDEHAESEVRASELKASLMRLEKQLNLLHSTSEEWPGRAKETGEAMVREVLRRFDGFMAALPDEVANLMAHHQFADYNWFFAARRLSEEAAAQCSAFAHRRIEEWAHESGRYLRLTLWQIAEALATELKSLDRFVVTDDVKLRVTLNPSAIYETVAEDPEVRIDTMLTGQLDINFWDFIWYVMKAITGMRTSHPLEEKVKAAAVAVFSRQIRRAAVDMRAQLSNEMPPVLDHLLSQVLKHYRRELANVDREIWRLADAVSASRESAEAEIARLATAARRVEELRLILGH